MIPVKLLARTAVRLQRAWQNRAALVAQTAPPFLDRLAALQRQLQHAQAIHDQAREHGWTLVGPLLQARIVSILSEMEKSARDARVVLKQPPVPVPSLTFLVAELRQVEDEFGELEIDVRERFVGAATEPIVLESIRLGSFAIRFYWQRLGPGRDTQCFDVVALNPNPAATDSRVTHPHVKNDRLCAGEAKVPLGDALDDARLADAFCIVRAVLRTYNADSPHVRLAEWGGVECHDCGCTVDEDDRVYCEACDHDFCSDCSGNCSVCGSTRCGGCLTPCAVCQDDCCGRCLQPAAHSGRACCPDCLNPCPACGAQGAKDEVTATDCPGCRAPQASSENSDPSSVPLSLSSSSSPDDSSQEPYHATTLEFSLAS
jgi:hypothetical protein